MRQLNFCLAVMIAISVVTVSLALHTHRNLLVITEQAKKNRDALAAELEAAKVLNALHEKELRAVVLFDSVRIKEDAERLAWWRDNFPIPRPKDRVIRLPDGPRIGRTIDGRIVTLPTEKDRLEWDAGEHLLTLPNVTKPEPRRNFPKRLAEVLDIPPREVNPLTNSVP